MADSTPNHAIEKLDSTRPAEEKRFRTVFGSAPTHEDGQVAKLHLAAGASGSFARGRAVGTDW
jgi:hypothetical protein